MPVTLRPTPRAIANRGISPLRTARHLQALLRAWFLTGLLTCAGLACAQIPSGISAGELAVLPAYCPYTQTMVHDPRGSNPTPESTKWAQTFGKNFWGLHHYCWALIRLHRAKAAGIPRTARQHHWDGAVNDFIYVIQNTTPDFVLLPEVYQRMGETYLLMGNPGNAVLAFKKSREQKPDYWPPYVAWADALVALGKKNEAKLHIEDGLRLMPTSPQLLAAYQQLGGNADRFVRSTQQNKPPQATSALGAGSAESTGAASAASAPQPGPAASASAG